MIKVKKYNRVVRTDICVAFCFFRPIEYKNPIKNLHIFLNDLNTTNIPIYSIELLYGNQRSIVPNVTKIVQSNSVIFSKENLWNVIEKNIPDRYSKIIFLDADIRFTNENWINLSSDILDSHKVIQPMEYCYRSIHGFSSYYDLKERIRPSISKGLKLKEKINIGLHYPGFAIGIDRNFFHKINGIFELGFNGCGDSLFWGAFDKDAQEYLPQVSSKFKEYEIYRQNVLDILKKNYDIVSYTPDNIALHLYHGSDKNRNYRNRDQYLPDSYKTFYNEYGVLEIYSLDQTKKDLSQYWIDRKEDE